MFTKRTSTNSRTLVNLIEHKRWSWIVGPFSVRKNLGTDIILFYYRPTSYFIHGNQTFRTLWPDFSCLVVWRLRQFILPHVLAISKIIIWILQNSWLQEIIIGSFIKVILVHVHKLLISLNLTLQFNFHLLLFIFFNLIFLLRCELWNLWISLITIDMRPCHLFIYFIMILLITLITLPENSRFVL